ncbi:T9SS type A sorting domain-containing protein [Flavobacterium sp.]|uniref:T9SS type A sorting domain-containing protein n=1 Tax=Flavobacterium sp. TaxID=239 RepID=UPI00374DCDA8
MNRKLHILFFSLLLSLCLFKGTDISAKSFKVLAGPTPDAKGILYVKQGSTGDGSSWNNALGEFRTAVESTNTAVLEIWVATGTYIPMYSFSFKLKEGIKYYGGFNGTEIDLSQRDWVKNKTILKGNRSSVITTNQLSNATVLSGFTISDGFTTTTPSGLPGDGAGVNSISSSIVISNCIFQNNNASRGGGIYNFSGFPIITNCYFTGNTGGAIYNSSSSPTIKDCTFEKNISFLSAVSNVTSQTTITNCNFTENRGEDGGAVYNKNSTVTFNNCNFVKNISISGTSGNNGGAGMFNVLKCIINIYNCSFIENSAYHFGGAIVSNNEITLKIVNSLFVNNKARTQGSELYSSDKITLDIINTTFVNNTAEALISDTGSIKFSNCIVWADFKNDIFYGPYTSKNSIILGKTDTSNDNINATGISDTQIFNNPAAGDYTLLEGGIAINKGNNTLYDPLVFGNLDLSGRSRITETTIDLGAYESKNGTLGIIGYIEKSNLKTYPNPVKGDYFTIENASTDGNAILYDLTGKQLKSAKIENGKAQVDVSNLPKGIYLLKTTKSETLKIVVD